MTKKSCVTSFAINNERLDNGRKDRGIFLDQRLNVQLISPKLFQQVSQVSLTFFLHFPSSLYRLQTLQPTDYILTANSEILKFLPNTEFMSQLVTHLISE